MRLSTSEQEWLNSQLEPEAKLFVSYPPRQPKFWQYMEPREEKTEKEIEEREDKYLRKHGIK